MRQSRLDRFYFSEHGWWTNSIKHLTHDGGSALSDHDPIIVQFSIWPEPVIFTHNLARGTNYFKMNPRLLKLPRFITSLKSAWDSKGAEKDNPHLCFLLANRRLRDKYIEKQSENKNNGDETGRLREELRLSKLALQDGCSLSEIEEFTHREDELRVAELKKHNGYGDRLESDGSKRETNQLNSTSTLLRRRDLGRR